MIIQELYNQWCKETKRNGAVLVGSSIREFFDWLDDNKYKLYKTEMTLRDDEEVKRSQIKGYKYILP